MMQMIIDGMVVEYLDEGQGPVILMLHGWQDTCRTFDALAARLPRFRIIRMDMPGFGGSSLPNTAWDVSAYVRFVDSFLRRALAEPAVIIGHSFGGRVAIRGIASGTFHAEKLVLIDSGGVSKSATLRNRVFVRIARGGKIALSLFGKRLRERARRILYRTAQSDYLAAGALRETFVRVVQEDLRSSAAQISIPTLIVWGENDTETPLSDAHIFASIIPDARLEVLSGAGHFVHQERPDDVAGLIRSFV